MKRAGEAIKVAIPLHIEAFKNSSFLGSIQKTLAA